MTTLRLYIACLASYNAGTLHGEWIDADSDPDVMREEIARILRGSPNPNVTVDCPQGKANEVPCTHSCEVCGGAQKVPSAEEWAIHDTEGFGSLLGEHPNLDRVALHTKMIEEHDGAWIAYCGNVGESHANEDDFSDSYRGVHSSPEDYAAELIEECHDLKSMGSLANYIDYEKFARDLGFDGYAFIPDGSGGVHVFSP